VDLARHVAPVEVVARVGLGVAEPLRLGHRLADAPAVRDLLEDVADRARDHRLDGDHAVAARDEVVEGPDDGKPGAHGGLVEELHAQVALDPLEGAVDGKGARDPLLVRRHHVDPRAQQAFVGGGHLPLAVQSTKTELGRLSAIARSRKAAKSEGA
jgi:hypothetical protein